jgi:putative hemolysin
MRLHTDAAAIRTTTNGLCLSLATTIEEVREVQRLRYEVFVESGGLASQVNAEGLDADQFDFCCDHLIVRDLVSLKAVGTYRLLEPSAARRAGKYYSEGEFDLTRLLHLRNATVEAGRACIDPRHRGGAVLMLLWSGIAAYMRLHRCEYLIGCASISLADGGANASAVFRALTSEQLAPPEYSVTPKVPLRLNDPVSSKVAQIPPLLRGYLKSGAWVCGEPAWDPDFHCADLFLLLPLCRLEARYARRYIKEESASVRH